MCWRELKLQLSYNQKPSLAYVKSTNPFELKEKVETLLKAQVDQGELWPVDKAEWAIPIVVVSKVMVVFVFMVIFY